MKHIQRFFTLYVEKNKIKKDGGGIQHKHNMNSAFKINILDVVLKYFMTTT